MKGDCHAACRRDLRPGSAGVGHGEWPACSAALRLRDGKQIWHTLPPGCKPPRQLRPRAIGAGSVDGHLRAYATKDGSVVGTSTRRRNSGPAIAEGIVLTTSGYGLWGGQSDNVLLAFSVEGK